MKYRERQDSMRVTMIEQRMRWERAEEARRRTAAMEEM